MAVSPPATKTLLLGIAILAVALLVACSSDDASPIEPSPTDGAPPAATATRAALTETPTPVASPTTAVPEVQTGVASVTPSLPPGQPGSDEPPATTAAANGNSVATGIGSYCWAGLCVDKLGVPTWGELPVGAGDTVTIAVPPSAPAFLEAIAQVFPAVEPTTLQDGSTIWLYPASPGDPIVVTTTNGAVALTVDLPPGRYVLSVGIFFDAGDIIYGVLLNVE